MKLSIIIKALNEEDKIEQCIKSILAATIDINSKIILVDSLSTDRTVEIASRYPVEIIQFLNTEDCSCGSAPELGFQQSSSDLIYLIDADMELDSFFLTEAMKFLLQDDAIAGVGGLIVDKTILTPVDMKRVQRYSSIKDTLFVGSLDGGGLYRRKAIAEVGYFSHQGLKACEETELGVRLITNNWQLIRLPLISVYHSGHKENGIRSLIRCWTNGRFSAHGAFIRSSFGKKWFLKALISQWFLLAPVIVNLFVISIYLLLGNIFNLSILFLFSVTWLTILFALSLKKKSFYHGLYSIVAWHMFFAAFIFKSHLKIKNPRLPISFRKL